ncbi:MAG: hypothetical protein IKL14_05380 [Alphaproteobacteria bacterium]|nr:hypothetical protein [Alphaproteobacteria bacterium]
MKKLTAGIFTVLMGLVSVNAADAAVASKGYVDNKFFTKQAQTEHVAAQKAIDDAQDVNINQNAADIATNAGAIASNAGKIGDATFTGANYVSSAEDLTAAVTALDVAVKNVAGGNLQLGRDAVDSTIIKDGEVKTDDIANSAVTEAKIADDAVTTGKIKNLNVTTAKIADKAVTADKLSDELSATISGKANSATTLSGYGITDAYTKTEADTKFIDTEEIKGYATDAELADVSGVANANKGAITVLNGDVSVEGSVKKQIKDTSDATLEAAKDYTDTLANGAVATNTAAIAAINNDATGILKQAKDYTDGKIEDLDLEAISRVPAECGTAGNYCVLTTNGTKFVWEVIVRDDTTLGEGDDGLYGDYSATEPAVTQ